MQRQGLPWMWAGLHGRQLWWPFRRKPYKIAGGYGIDCIRCGAYGGGGGNCPGVEQA